LKIRPELMIEDGATFEANRTGKASVAALFQEHAG